MTIWRNAKPYIRQIFRAIPKIKFLYVLCQRYVDDYRGEHNSNMYTNGEFGLLRRNIEKFSTVFDVGAGVGEWAKMALSLKNNLNIHCFEPSAFTYRILISNNFPANVTCNHFGLGSKCERKELFVFGEGGGGNSLYKRYGVKRKVQKTEQVRLETLENYCRKKNIREIDFIKIDVEGHDLDVLRGIKNLLKQNRIGMIQFEYGGCNIDSRTLLKDFFDFFEDLDYRIYKISPSKIKFIENYSQDLENFRYANYLAVQKNLKPI